MFDAYKEWSEEEYDIIKRGVNSDVLSVILNRPIEEINFIRDKKGIITDTNIEDYVCLFSDTELSNIYDISINKVRDIRLSQIRNDNSTIRLLLEAEIRNGKANDEIYNTYHNIRKSYIDSLRKNVNPSIWSPKNLALLGTKSDSEIARVIGVTHEVVANKRKKLDIPHFRENIEQTLLNAKVLGTDSDENIAKRYNISTYRVNSVRQKHNIHINYEKFWTKERISLLGTDTDRKISEILGVSLGRIRDKRHELSIPSKFSYKKHVWTADIINDISNINYTNAFLAKKYNIAISTINKKRRDLGITMVRKKEKTWSDYENSLLGTAPDPYIANLLGRTSSNVSRQRCRKGISAYGHSNKYKFTPEELALLGTDTDKHIAKVLNVCSVTIANLRHMYGIEPYANTGGAGVKWTSEMIDTIRDTSLSTYKLSQKLGISHMTIFKKQKELGFI